MSVTVCSLCDVVRMTLCVILTLTSVTHVYGATCVKRDRCSCVYDDGSGMIDLSSIGRTDGEPLFMDQVSVIDYYWYSFNPCYPFSEGTCQNVAACQYDYQYALYYDIGNVDSADFQVNDISTEIYYKSLDGGRNTIVTLICDDRVTTPKLDVTGEQIAGYYTMSLTSAAACKVPVSSGGGSSGGMSGGSVLLIIFFVTSSLYLIVGVSYNKFRQGATGKDLVPNVVFWLSLPGLIKDGFNFLRGLVFRRTVYISMKCNVHSPTANRYTCETCGNKFATRADKGNKTSKIKTHLPVWEGLSIHVGPSETQ